MFSSRAATSWRPSVAATENIHPTETTFVPTLKMAPLRSAILDCIFFRGKTSMNVLIADDCKKDRDWLAGIFIQRFPALLPVHHAENGQQAVEKCLALNPAVVVLDFQMPVLDGVKAAEQIFRDSPHTPIIIFSSEIDNERIERLAKAMAERRKKSFTLLSKTATLAQAAAAIKIVLEPAEEA